jgi:hypothetical protein
VNNQVSELLFNESAELTKLYCYLLSHMDCSTCVVGVDRRVSYQSMKELLDVPAIKGRAAVPSSKAKVRAVIYRLCVIGLVSTEGEYVYKLNLESSGLSEVDSE